MASGIATVHGVAYEWSTFEPLDNAVIKVNTTPAQSMVAKSGVYSFDLPNGTYLIEATYYENGTITLYGEDVITVADEGSYVVDLLLLPSYTATEGDSAAVRQEENDLNLSDSSVRTSGRILLVSSLILAVVLITLFYQVRYKKQASSRVSPPRRRENPENNPTVLVSAEFEPSRPGSYPEKFRESSGDSSPEKIRQLPQESTVSAPSNTTHKPPVNSKLYEEDFISDNCTENDVPSAVNILETPKVMVRSSEPVPADLQEILDILVSQGGRMTQKDMRKRLKYSEGKVSLMLLDLEKRGKIQKFKKGRGNIIFLVEEEK